MRQAYCRFIITIALLAFPAAASAQVTGLTAGYERQHDRYTYRFENPSTFDTTELVPHFFEQYYVADNNWLWGRATWSAGRLRLRSEAAVTPQITTRGDDFDTFFQPSGDVIVAGTTGNVSLRSWRVWQDVELTPGAVRAFIGYGFQRDRARFHEGFKSIRHTQPPSIVHSIVTTRETTWSDLHEIAIGVRSERRRGPWRVQWHAHAAPSIARLRVDLPDKYPGQLLVFSAAPLVARASASVGRQFGGVLVEGGAGYGRMMNAREEAALRRNTLTISGAVSWIR